MKFSMKAIAAAVAFAAAGSASAAIDSAATGNGELFFSIRDNGNQQSYVMDLNINMDNFLPSNATSVSYAADAEMQSFLNSGSGDYSWAVMAGDAVGQTTIGGLRYLTTSADAANIGGNTNQELAGFSLVDGYITDTSNKIALVGNGVSAISASTEASYFGVVGDTWWQNSSFNATASGLGTSIDFYMLSNSGSTAGFFTKTKPVDVTTFNGQWTLDANGTLSFNSTAPSAVPVPAAVWLLGSAMVGLVGVSRRKNQA